MSAKHLLSTILIFASIAVMGQRKVETTFIVDGECEMCKDRIEGALDTKGIIFSEWDVEKKQLFVVYRPKMIAIEDIHKRINAVGHDTEHSLAPDSVYETIHHCCRYRATVSPEMMTPPDTLSDDAPQHIRSHE